MKAGREPIPVFLSLLFAPFSPDFETASWPTFLSMFGEAVSKSDKKCIKRSNIKNTGISS
jgi:hypothetical protein